MTNKYGCSPTIPENVYFADNEQESTVFCFTLAEHNLIKLILYNN